MKDSVQLTFEFDNETKKEFEILPLDVIVTARPLFCCLATSMGLLVGTSSIDGYRANCPKCKVEFVDNDYLNFHFSKYKQMVWKIRPKYATVRDIFTKEQCKKMGIEYYDIDTILSWAKELNKYAENIILIPKYKEAIEQIPKKFILGYSIPTSYGGTNIPFEEFLSHKIHLLGGSPEKQYKYYQAYPDNIVSLDMNYLVKLSKKGIIYIPFNRATNVRELNIFGAKKFVYPLYVAFSINLNYFIALFKNKLEV